MRYIIIITNKNGDVLQPMMITNWYELVVQVILQVVLVKFLCQGAPSITPGQGLYSSLLQDLPSWRFNDWIWFNHGFHWKASTNWQSEFLQTGFCHPMSTILAIIRKKSRENPSNQRFIAVCRWLTCRMQKTRATGWSWMEPWELVLIPWSWMIWTHNPNSNTDQKPVLFITWKNRARR